MNYRMIRYVLGQIMKLGAALMGLPLLVSLYYLDEGIVPEEFLTHERLLIFVWNIFRHECRRNEVMIFSNVCFGS